MQLTNPAITVEVPETTEGPGPGIRPVHKSLHTLSRGGGSYVLTLFEERRNDDVGMLLVRAYDRAKRETFWLPLSQNQVVALGGNVKRSPADVVAALARRWVMHRRDGEGSEGNRAWLVTVDQADRSQTDMTPKLCVSCAVFHVDENGLLRSANRLASSKLELSRLAMKVDNVTSAKRLIFPPLKIGEGTSSEGQHQGSSVKRRRQHGKKKRKKDSSSTPSAAAHEVSSSERIAHTRLVTI